MTDSNIINAADEIARLGYTAIDGKARERVAWGSGPVQASVTAY